MSPVVSCVRRPVLPENVAVTASPWMVLSGWPDHASAQSHTDEFALRTDLDLDADTVTVYLHN